jgi:8-amino-7-oxononanoate synthase
LVVQKFTEQLKDLREQGRYRQLATGGGIDFTSNDYLMLSQHPALRAAAIEALQDGLPLGATASRLLRGQHNTHAALEEFAADHFGAERALFFATGFQANQAIFATLPDRHDTIIYDALIHASARAAIHDSPAQKIKIPHNNLAAFAAALAQHKKTDEQCWLAVESVYSMDGDCAPLPALLALAQQYDAILVVDEAHGTGVFGASGKGLCEDLPHSEQLITLHTCGKALGIAGGLVCGAAPVIDYLINKARGFIYSTAPMPLQALLVQKALEIVVAEPGRRTRLWQLHAHAQRVLPVPVGPSQIIPVLLGDDSATLAAAAALQAAGFDIRAIRPPTVPAGTARLRLSLNIGVSEDDLTRLAAMLPEIMPSLAA